MNVKYLDRPPLVHFLKLVIGTAGETRCGIVYESKDSHPTRTTAWYCEVTCSECSPYP